ncbi:C4-dicarboxylate TRAP transporter substrate-binding protein [Hoeflea prorocentri]|uniref:C4-dicarboxylate TRAP transporter substrate-binding protein n=1 Tax=Hoeflea prorocentri TaxID=1922333 RepID=A0A9X3ZI29_9HYPH|nr:C4-dicarboxylate TRAP transporter substrate-binding protein [Hoeflea prorocentri]MCY6381989.1 C4-dicarboxylate TRAP transporter substrate-binding protein [Hoeflea prorocentri]MDA5399789.1 C4-dicarboxylate TRAP transporter substrate-binding protein [Hoeflea prorocentri]
MSKLLRRSFMAAVAAAGLAASAAVPATATETIKMIAIDGYPERSMWVKEFSGFFIPRVDEELARTGTYKIDWQQAYGGQIVKPRGVLEGIKLGLGDIGIVTTIFHNSALPSQAISAATPMVSSDARIVAKAVDEIAKEYPQMQAEFASENQVYLATGVVLDSYQIFSKTPVKSLDDLSGLKLAGAGYNLRYLEGLKDVAGVRGGLPNFYNMLQTGVVDAAMLWPEAAMTFKINEVAPHMLKVDLGAVNSKTVTVNKDVWDKLPDEVKDVLQSVAVEYRDRVAKVAMERAATSLDAFEEAGGTVVVLTEGQRSAWADAMPNIAEEWAGALDKKGAPGTAMLGSYVQKLKDAGSVPVRDWAATN